MATTCKLDISPEEEKQHWIYSIQIPHEINHNFLGKAKLLAQEGKIAWIRDIICFPDYGSGVKYEPYEIDELLWGIDELESNIDSISQMVPIPTMIGMYDGRVIIWYESNRNYDLSLDWWLDSKPYSTYVEILTGSYANCEKKDVLYIFSLIRGLALKAKKLNKPLRFIGE